MKNKILITDPSGDAQTNNIIIKDTGLDPYNLSSDEINELFKRMTWIIEKVQKNEENM